MKTPTAPNVGEIKPLGGGTWRLRLPERYVYLWSPKKTPTQDDFKRKGFDLSLLQVAFPKAMANTGAVGY